MPKRKSPTEAVASKSASKVELSKIERDELSRNEIIVQKGWHTFIEVGNALARIKNGQLYRESHRTFESYCRERFEMSRVHAYRLVNAAEVCALLPNGESPRPLNESQIRPLTLVPRDRVADVWLEAVRKSGKNGITAKAVRAAASGFRPKSSDASQKSTSCRQWQSLCLRRIKSFSAFIRDDDPEKALGELEAMKLLIEQVAMRRFSKDENEAG